jgi:hypothetical protein
MFWVGHGLQKNLALYLILVAQRFTAAITALFLNAALAAEGTRSPSKLGSQDEFDRIK